MKSSQEGKKTSVNRVRRQLLIGAGAAPLFVTLRAATANAANWGVASGAAPVSGVLQASAALDGGTGTATTEDELYRLISGESTNFGVFSGTQRSQESLKSYYGVAGSGSVSRGSSQTGILPNDDPVTYYVVTCEWTLGQPGTLADGSENLFVPNYETRKLSSVGTPANNKITVSYNILDGATELSYVGTSKTLSAFIDAQTVLAQAHQSGIVPETGS
ncbi:MAG: hypothetical protein Q4D38_12440 [Planctomycetia bacterium]|nr:hypothetical protein [Planctomycetia bacterium]